MSETSRLSASDAQRAVRNMSALMTASLLSKGALLLWQLILWPWIGNFDYGIYGTVMGLFAIATSVSSFSMGLIVIRDVAREPQKAGRYWSSMLLWQTVLTLLAYIGMNGFAIGYSETIRGFVALAGLNLFVDLIGNMGHDLLLAREAMLKTSVVEIGHIAFRIGLTVLAVALGWGLLGVYGAAFVSGLLRSAVLFALNWRDGLRPQFPIDRRISIPLLINSAPLACAAFLSQASQHADKLMTTGIIGEEGTGFLTPAFFIHFGVIELFSTTVLVAAYPLLSRYYADGRNPLFGMMIEKLALYMVVITLPLALGISLFAEPVIGLLLGADYAPMGGILSILIWYTLITMIGNVFSKGLLIQNQQRRLLLFRGAGLTLNVALNALLLSQWGDPRAAAIASIFSETLVLCLLLRHFRARGWEWRRIAGSIRRLLCLAALAALVMLGLRAVNPALALALGLAVYAAGLLYGRIFSAGDWDMLYRLAAVLPGGGILRRYWQRDVELSW